MKLKILLIACLIANISQVYSDPKDHEANEENGLR